MKLLLTACLAVCTSGIVTGATFENVNETTRGNLQTEIATETTEKTTILFSGFYLPSTPPPSVITNFPEHVETIIPAEGLPLDDAGISIIEEKNTNASEKADGEQYLKSNQVVTIGAKEGQDSNEANAIRIEPTRNAQLSSVQPETPSTARPRWQPKRLRVPLTQAMSTEAPQSEDNEVLSQLERDVQEQEYSLEAERLREVHPCHRSCQRGQKMTCRYVFKVEWYESLGKACFNCPRNISDCYRKDCIAVDGVSRPLTVVNNMLPGPSVQVCEDDDIEILLVNGLMSETTTIHWHGLHQRASPYMDGVPFVSQCPVLPKASFLYRFPAANPGTHFWHSHSGVQRADGVSGALVVRTPRSEDPHGQLYDEDLSEHIVQVIDWSGKETIAIFTGHHHARTDNKPQTLLVNGRGIYGNAPPASFTVEKGKRYRFRLINAGVLNCPVELTIDNHKMLVISSDGSDIAPIEVESLVSYAGERWDFVVEANAAIGNYWMRYRGLMDCDERFTSAHTVSVLHYKNSSNELPHSPIGYFTGFGKGKIVNPLNQKLSHLDVNANELHSLAVSDMSLKPIADKRVVLFFDFRRIDNPHFYKKGSYGFYDVADRREQVLTPQINNVSLTVPPFPLLSQYSDINPDLLCSKQNLTNCSTEYCECMNVIDLKNGEVVELVLIDIGEAYDANHPFHLHGHAFRVVAMDRVSNQTSVEEVLRLDESGQIKRNLVDPPIKDTVTVPDGGYTIVRFIADNPGYWMFHCHLEFHVELGMAVIFKVGEHSDFPPVPQGFPRCGDYIPPPPTPPSAQNEVYWSYNASDVPEGSFSFPEGWPLGIFNKSPSNFGYSGILYVSSLLCSLGISITLNFL